MTTKVFLLFVAIAAGQMAASVPLRKPQGQDSLLRARRRNIFRIIMRVNKFRLKDPINRSNQLFQGDITMTRELRAAIAESRGDSINLQPGDNARQKRAAVSNHGNKWIGNDGAPEIPYVFELSNLHTRNVIEKAMAHWSAHVPCLKFVKRRNQQDYLNFYAGNGCSSSVGRTGGKQHISIGAGCESVGVVIHEIGHALGFWHEHSRPDRDQHVTVNWYNIRAGAEDDFKKITGSMVNSLGVAYDVDSIMHYPSWAFQAAPGLHTIVRKDGTIIRGNRQRLSKLDIQQANQLYCGLATTPPPTTSQPVCHYTDSHDHCPVWKTYGFCEPSSIYSAFMMQSCKKSCLC